MTIYVGSTIESLSRRLARHKNNCYNVKERGYNMLLYKTIRTKEWDDFYIELYENYSCKSKEELNKREGEIIRQIGTMNVKISGNVIDKKEYMKTYYIKITIYGSLMKLLNKGRSTNKQKNIKKLKRSVTVKDISKIRIKPLNLMMGIL